jgi:hypothetical protein
LLLLLCGLLRLPSVLLLLLLQLLPLLLVVGVPRRFPGLHLLRRRTRCCLRRRRQ